MITNALKFYSKDFSVRFADVSYWLFFRSTDSQKVILFSLPLKITVYNHMLNDNPDLVHKYRIDQYLRGKAGLK